MEYVWDKERQELVPLVSVSLQEVFQTETERQRKKIEKPRYLNGGRYAKARFRRMRRR